MKEHVRHLHAQAAMHALRATKLMGLIKTSGRNWRPRRATWLRAGERIRHALSFSIEASQIESKECGSVFPGVRP